MPKDFHPDSLAGSVARTTVLGGPAGTEGVEVPDFHRLPGYRFASHRSNAGRTSLGSFSGVTLMTIVVPPLRIRRAARPPIPASPILRDKGRDVLNGFPVDCANLVPPDQTRFRGRGAFEDTHNQETFPLFLISTPIRPKPPNSFSASENFPSRK